MASAGFKVCMTEIRRPTAIRRGVAFSVDAIMAKRNLGTRINDTDLVIALGPGFYAGKDAHGLEVRAEVSGVIRGLLPDGFEVRKGMEIGGIDPRARQEYCFTISDKARAIASGVLRAILRYLAGA